VQGVAHDEFAWSDFNGPPAEACDVINSRLQYSIVCANNVGIADTNPNHGPVFHFRMHRARKLFVLPAQRSVAGLRRKRGIRGKREKHAHEKDCS
jgi:hypothetical protein